MPTKKKKYPKLPNGFGSIRKLSGNRRNPYCVVPPCQGYDLNGNPQYPKPLCYVDSWYKGFAVLTAYNAGTYTAGMERTIYASDLTDISSMPELVRQILGNYALITQKVTGQEAKIEKTFTEIYEEYYKDKYESPDSHYSKSALGSVNAAYKNCMLLHNRTFSELRYNDLQAVIDNCPLKHSSKELILSLFHQLYAYAIKMELVETDYSKYVSIKSADDDEHGVPFSPEELQVLWNDRKDPIAELILIMCYSGHRISEYGVMEINLNEEYMHGGLKTKTSRERIVPIHSAILPLIKRRLRRDKKLLPAPPNVTRELFKKYCAKHNMQHTPHDTRHTFAMLCDKYGVNENDKKRMLGHAFADVTNKVYGHRELEGLREQIEKIKAPC